jgi:predicted nucleotidyltransferase
MSQAGAEHKLYDPDFIRSLRPFDQEGNPTVVALHKDPEQRFAGAVFQIEEWYAELPQQWRSHLSGRLRSTDDALFSGALWELYLHHYLSGIEDVQVQELEAPVADGTADFLVSYAGQQIVCEAYALQRGGDERELWDRLHAFQKECVQLLPPGYVLSASFWADPTSDDQAQRIVRWLASGEDVRGIAQWVANEIASKQPQRGDRIDRGRLPGPGLTIRVLIAGADHRSHVALIWPTDVERQTERVIQTVRRKARDKRPSRQPFVLFVGYRQTNLHQEDWLNLTYGPAWFRLDPDGGQTLAPPQEGGLFTSLGREDVRATYLSGLVTSPIILSPESGRWRFYPVAYLNPLAEFPVPLEMFSRHIPVWAPAPSEPGAMVRLDTAEGWRSDEAVQQVVDAIRERYQPEKIILFGSRISGQPVFGSDLDVLIIKETDKRWPDRIREVSGLIRPRPLPLDIIVKTPQEIDECVANGDRFIGDILRRGRVVYDGA